MCGLVGGLVKQVVSPNPTPSDVVPPLDQTPQSARSSFAFSAGSLLPSHTAVTALVAGFEPPKTERSGVTMGRHEASASKQVVQAAVARLESHAFSPQAQTFLQRMNAYTGYGVARNPQNPKFLCDTQKSCEKSGWGQPVQSYTALGIQSAEDFKIVQSMDFETAFKSNTPLKAGVSSAVLSKEQIASFCEASTDVDVVAQAKDKGFIDDAMASRLNALGDQRKDHGDAHVFQRAILICSPEKREVLFQLAAQSKSDFKGLDPKQMWGYAHMLRNSSYQDLKSQEAANKLGVKSFEMTTFDAEGRPRNGALDKYGIPSTGIQGTGWAYGYGPNMAADPLVTMSMPDFHGMNASDLNAKYPKQAAAYLKMHVQNPQKYHHPTLGDKLLDISQGKQPGDDVCVLIFRGDKQGIGIPGGMVEAGDTITGTLKKEFGEEAMDTEHVTGDQANLLDLAFSKSDTVWCGRVNGDGRQTDHAWNYSECVVASGLKGNEERTVELLMGLCAGDDAGGLGLYSKTDLESMRQLTDRANSPTPNPPLTEAEQASVKSGHRLFAAHIAMFEEAGFLDRKVS